MNLFSRKAASVGALTVLALTAGGIAWAESSSPATGPTPVSQAHAGHDGESMPHHGGHWRHGFDRRVLHGEMVLQTPTGFVTAVVARGTVTAIDADSISVKSADGVTTTFAIDAKTKARSAGKVVPLTDVHTGDTVGVLGIKKGSGAAVAKMIRDRH